MNGRLLAVPLFLTLVAPTLVRACTCSQAPPGKCLELPADAAVFLGSVTAVENVTPAPAAASAAPNAPAANRITRYHFRVDEHFAGPEESEFDVYSGGEDGDCGYLFEASRKYLVFTHRGNDGRLFATICSGTRPAGETRALLPQLRAMRSGDRVASVYGVLRRTDPPFLKLPDHPDEPLKNVSIKLQSADDRFETSTDGDGVFTYYDVHAGDYTLTARVSSHAELAQRTFPGGSPHFKIPEGACYEYDVDVLPTGHLSGSVLGPDGTPVALASLELYRAGSYAESRPGLWGFQGAKGVFDFDHIGPGDYVLVLNRENRLDPKSPFPRSFYPGVQDARRAQVIHLKDGEERLHLDIRVKNAYPTRSILVRVKWSGRKLPGDITVTAHAAQGEDPAAEPLGDELYRITILESADYVVSASQIPDRSAASTKDAQGCVLPSRIDTSPTKVSGGDKSTQEISLVFPEPACARQ